MGNDLEERLMAGFEGNEETIRVRLEEHEVGLLQSLLSEMLTLLEADVRADPVNRRLFPDAYDSEEDSATYRELVGEELRTTKVSAVKNMKGALEAAREGSLELSKEDAATWLPVLTDLRLAIGTRNDVTEEKMAEEVDPEDPQSAGILVLHWLGWLQESLVDVVTRMESEESE